MGETASGAAPELEYERRGGVGWITINRPRSANAISPDVRVALVRLIEDLDADPWVRCVVLTAAGERHFCTGADLKAASYPVDESRPEGAPARPPGLVARELAKGPLRLLSTLIDCQKPTIAAVNGLAAGFGVHLALACDLVVAADHARFSELFVRRGLLPDGGGAYILTRVLGLQRAKELVFLGDDISATRAFDLGMVTRVVPGRDLLDETAALAERIAEGPTVALSWAKWCLNRAAESTRDLAFRDEAAAMEIVRNTRDADEGVQSFLEGRSPDYRGW